MSNTIDVQTENQETPGAAASLGAAADVFTEITVPKKIENNMEARYVLYGSGNKDALTTISSRLSDERTVETEIYAKVLQTDAVYAEIESVYRGISDIYTEIHPRGYEQIQAEIEVRPHTNMSATYETIKPPILSNTYHPNKDTFTKKEDGYQTINYGKSSAMVIGDGDAFQSFFGFEKAKLDSRYVITDIRLELTYLGEVPDGYDISLHTASREWFETGTTYRNKPSKLDFITYKYSIDRERNIISFDLTEPMKLWAMGKDDTHNGFILSTTEKEPLYFRTRETITPPKLIVSYYDSVVPSTGRSAVRSEIFIAYHEESEISAEIEVGSTYDFARIHAEVHVHRPEEILYSEKLSEITVSRGEIATELTAVRNDDSTVYAVIGVRSEEKIRDKNAVIHVTRDTILTDVIVKQYGSVETYVDVYANRDKVLTELTVAIPREDDIFAEITANDIHVYYIETEITPKVIKSSDIFAEIEPNIKSDIPTEIAVRRDKVFVAIQSTAIGNGDVHTEISVEVGDENIVNADLFVSRNETHTEIFAVALGQSDAHTEISVRRPKNEDMNTDIFVNRLKIYTEIFAVALGRSDVHTEVSARRPKNEDMNTDIFVSRGEVYTEIFAVALGRLDAHTEISIRRPKNEDMNTDIFVGRDKIYTEIFAIALGQSDTYTEVSVKQTESARIDTDIFISRGEVHAEITPFVSRESVTATEITAQRRGDDKIHAEIYVSNRSEIYVEIDTNSVSVVPTEITMSRQTIKTEIMIPYRGDGDISILIQPRVIYAGDIYCQITMGKPPKGYAYIM